MNLLVTGANGQLGTHLRMVCNKTTINCVFTDVDELDITDSAAVDRLVRQADIDIIVNCAAYTNVDRAESEPQLADRLNHIGAANLAHAALDNGATLVHISTDYVFGGNQGNTPRTELEPTNPTGVYGQTKLLGEQAVIASGCKNIIIRTAWLYSEFGKNFMRTMLDLSAHKDRLKVVFDQVGTPTYAGDLAAAILTIINTPDLDNHLGLYHYSNEGVCSWFDFTKMIAAYSGQTACDIQPCHSDEFPSPVRRPAYSVLDKTKVKATFGLAIPYWTDSLRQCLSALL